MSQIQNQPYVPNSPGEITAETLEKLQAELNKLASSGDTIPPDSDGNTTLSFTELPQLEMPKLAAGSSVALDLLLDLIDEKSRDTEVKAGISSIKANASVREAKNQEKIDKIQEQIDKLKNASFWDKLGNVFKYIGMAVAAIACVAMIATGVGGALGVAGLVLLSVSLANQILDTVGEAVSGQGWSLTSGIAKLAGLMGASKDVQQYLKLGLDLAISIAALICTLGASSGSTINTASKAITIARKCATVAQGVTSIASSGAEIASGVNVYDAEVSRADQKRLQAILEQIQMINDLVNEHLKAVLEQAQKNTEVVTDIVKQNADTQTAILTNGGAAPMA
ncbi:MAG: type III secretion system translocon subunit SctE [Desulfovibrio sp.]|nr:type III secretion system translocon subunit SctE [Desulfovibrio sp.]